MNWLDIFSGGGGVTTGLQQAGHIVTDAIEYDPSIAACYQENHPEHDLHIADIRDQDIIKKLSPRINAIWASPVCKDHSEARTSPLLAPRTDASIGTAIIPYIDAIEPELVIIENVRLYQYHASFQMICAHLLKRHYNLDWRVLNTAHYGVPQNRQRLILQARRGPIAWPEKHAVLSWNDALTGLLPLLQDAPIPNWQRELWFPDLDQHIPLMTYGIYKRAERKKEIRELAWDKQGVPSRTVVASASALTTRVVTHQDGSAKMLGVSGNARLQTFPDEYLFPKKRELAMEIIGNAVPCEFVKNLTSLYQSTQVKQCEYPGRQLASQEIV